MPAQAVSPVVIREGRRRISLVEGIIGIALLGGAVWFGRREYKKWRASQEAKKIGDDPDAQVAARIKTAIQGAGTNTEELLRAAGDVQNWKRVAESYKKLYGTNIEDDIRDDLKDQPEDLKKFFDIINLRPDPSTPTQLPPKAQLKFKAGDIFISKGDTNVRKTPVKTPRFSLTQNNVVALVKKGWIIGPATGRFSMDSKNAVLFYEATAFSAETLRPEYKVWAAASQLEVLKREDWEKNKKEWVLKTIRIPKKIYEAAASPLGITNGETANHNIELHTTKPADILDNKMRLMIKAPAASILGYPIMEMDTGKEKFVKFETINGFRWWVKKDNIKEVRRNI